MGGTAVFSAALVAEVGVIACFKLTGISFLWYNLIGCALVITVALLVQPLVGRRTRLTRHRAIHEKRPASGD